LIWEGGKLMLATEEGASLAASEAELQDVIGEMYRPPLGGRLLPDGLKALFWDPPFLVAAHQLPPAFRPVSWIANDSPEDFGPGTQYRTVRLSFPYALTLASFVQFRGGLQLTGHNELYFSNQPLRSENDHVGYPALLNVSCIHACDRLRSWICTQYLERGEARDWCSQLQSLLCHTWNGAFNRSSERHEGQSMYQFSAGAHPDLHPVERWEQRSLADHRFALTVNWKPVPLGVGQLARAMLAELMGERASGLRIPRGRRVGLLPRLVRHLQKKGAAADGGKPS
jgi:hypothetical protein